MTTTDPLTPTDLGRAWRELPGWRWMRGMEAIRSHDSGGVYSYRIDSGDGPWRPETFGLMKVSIGAYPNTTDHATVGCLHALAEEVVGGPVDVWGVSHLPGRPFSACHVHASVPALIETRPSLASTDVLPRKWQASGPTRAHALYALVREVSRG